MKSIQLTPEQMAQLDEADSNPRVDAIKLVVEGFTVSEVAEQLDVHPNSIYAWIRRFRTDSVEGLQDKPRSGRPLKVDQHYRDTLQHLLEGEATGWSAEQIRDEMHRRTGAFISTGYLRQVLRQLGYSSGWRR